MNNKPKYKRNKREKLFFLKVLNILGLKENKTFGEYIPQSNYKLFSGGLYSLEDVLLEKNEKKVFDLLKDSYGQRGIKEVGQKFMMKEIIREANSIETIKPPIISPRDLFSKTLNSDGTMNLSLKVFKKEFFDFLLLPYVGGLLKDKISINKLIKFLKIVLYIKRKHGISFNEIAVNMPTHRSNPRERATQFNSLITFLERIKRYKLSDLLETLSFLNYMKLRDMSKEEIKTHCRVVQEAIEQMRSNAASGSSKRRLKVTKGYPIILEDNILLDGFNKLSFSKDPSEVLSVGLRTGCCFKIDGYAKDLVRATLRSPLALIIQNKKADSPNWFTFAWEYFNIRDDAEGLSMDIIFDNIESKGLMDFAYVRWLINKLKCYENFYLGTLRNDIDRKTLTAKEGEILSRNKTLKRNHLLIGEEKAFNRYSYDDSENLYKLTPLIKREYNKDEELYMIPMENIAELHRAAYLEKFLYGSESDTKLFLKNTPIPSLSFVLRTNRRFYGYIKTTKENRWLRDIISEKPLDREKDNLICIEDIILPKMNRQNYHIMSDFTKTYIRELLSYVKREKVTHLIVSLNQNSKPLFERRLAKKLEELKVKILYMEDFKRGKEYASIKPDNEKILKMNKKYKKLIHR